MFVFRPDFSPTVQLSMQKTFLMDLPTYRYSMTDIGENSFQPQLTIQSFTAMLVCIQTKRKRIRTRGKIILGGEGGGAVELIFL